MHFSQSFAAKLTAGLLAVTGMIAPAFAVSGTVDAEGGLRLRNASSTDAAVLETIPDGSQIEVSGITESGWYQVSFQDTQGYVSTDYVVLSETVELPTVAEPVYGKVTEGPLNVRSAPSTDSEKVDSFSTGKVLTILETLDGWYKIKSGPIIGYISADPQYTATGQEARDIAMQNATLKAVINTDVLNVRTEPNTEAKIWTQIVKDERYPVVAQLDGWVEIDLDSVDEEDTSKVDKAFISTRDNNVEVRYALNEAIKFSPAEVAANNAASRRSKVVNYALQFVGNPYVWGGTSLTKGVDCSGFTMQVMKQFGVSLPHYSGSQAKMGKAVTSGNMRPGDLIFYAGSGGQVNHVAIYIGNGQVVHAASRKSGIKISTWNYRSPVAIRNVLGD